MNRLIQMLSRLGIAQRLWASFALLLCVPLPPAVLAAMEVRAALLQRVWPRVARGSMPSTPDV